MKEIVNRLHENRQIELAKSIVEAAGYKVTNESDDIEARLRSKVGKPVQGIAYYGTELADEFLELQDTDPRIEEIVRELGMEDEVWPEDEHEPSDDVYMKVLLAYYKEKSGKVNEAEGVKVNKDDDYLADDEDIEMSLEYLKGKMIPISQLLDNYGGIDLFRQEREGTEELDIPCEMLDGNYDNVYTISEDDEGGREIMMIHSDMDRKELKVQRMSDGSVCILEEVPGMGQFVYQSQWGYEVLFKKF